MTNEVDNRSPYEKVSDEIKRYNEESEAALNNGDNYKYIVIQVSPRRYAIARRVYYTVGEMPEMHYEIVSDKLTWLQTKTEYKRFRAPVPEGV